MKYTTSRILLIGYSVLSSLVIIMLLYQIMSLKEIQLSDLWSAEPDMYRIPEHEEINPLYYETDVHGILQIKDKNDVVLKRKQLIQFLWGEQGFPVSRVPDKVEEGIIDIRYADLNLEKRLRRAYWINQISNTVWGLDSIMYPVMRSAGFKNLKMINRLVVNMDWGLNSIIYHFIPVQSNQGLIIYHQGHRGDFIYGKNIIRAFVAKGYSVLGISMPLVGMNSQPVVDSERFGKLKIMSHEYMQFLKPKEGHVVQYFLEPVAAALNYAQKYGYTQTHMIGISGGGWTTTLYAAIDPRISHSYPVAGSLPIYLRAAEADRGTRGDYEQIVPELYEIANYLELYILGAHGAGRKQIQILNRYDSSAFRGVAYRTYEQAAKDTVNALGDGSFEVYLDESHEEHKISEQALNRIFDDLL